MTKGEDETNLLSLVIRTSSFGHSCVDFSLSLRRRLTKGFRGSARCARMRTLVGDFPPSSACALVKILLSETQVRDGVVRMAREIVSVYGERPLTIVAVMTGSVVLLADLIRLLSMPLRVGVLQASSYKGNTSRGQLTINAELMPAVTGRDVLLLDDIFDTGHTLDQVAALVKEMQPASVRSSVLLRKLGRQEVAYSPDFAAFEIPDEFVVGYGLDYRDAYRNLPYIAALEDEDIANTLP